MQKYREDFVKKKRRDKLWSILQARRGQQLEQEQENIKADFKQCYAKINEQNYAEHRLKLADLVHCPDYTYQIVVFGSIVYEYLMDNPLDQPSLCILKYITQHEEVQIPQTQQLIDWLIFISNQHILDSVVITANLLQHPRYHGPFRNKLVSSNYVKQIHKKCQQNQLAIFMGQIICSLLGSQPRLPYDQIQYFCQQLTRIIHIQQNIWNLDELFSSIRSKFAPDSRLADIFLRYFSKLTKKEANSQLTGFLDFIFYSALSQIYDLDFLKPMRLGLRISASTHSQVTVLRCLGIYVQGQVLQEVEADILNLIWDLLVSSQQNTVKQQALTLLNALSIGQIATLFETLEHSDAFQIIQECIKVQILAFQALKFMLTILEVENPSIENIEKTNIKNLIENIVLDNGGQIEEVQVAQMILNLL